MGSRSAATRPSWWRRSSVCCGSSPRREPRPGPSTRSDPSGTPEAPGFVLERDGRRVRTARWPDGLVDIVLWEVFHDAIRDEIGSVAIHAGAVSYRGRGIVFPAPMNTGKTTLVGALICAGFDYLSDEAALIEMGGTLLPFLKPLTFEPGSYDLLPQLRALSENGSGLRRQHVMADELRLGSSGTACEIGWVVTFSRRAGAPTTLEPLTPGEALAALAKNSFNLHRLGARGIDTLGSVVRGATALHLEVGDLQDAVQAILGLVGTSRDRILRHLAAEDELDVMDRVILVVPAREERRGCGARPDRRRLAHGRSRSTSSRQRRRGTCSRGPWSRPKCRCLRDRRRSGRGAPTRDTVRGADPTGAATRKAALRTAGCRTASTRRSSTRSAGTRFAHWLLAC